MFAVLFIEMAVQINSGLKVLSLAASVEGRANINPGSGNWHFKSLQSEFYLHPAIFQHF